jgi:hypothetical protein
MTVPAFLLASGREPYAAAAAHERRERERLYPQRIRERRISEEDAHADWWAWITIAQWLAGEPMPLLFWDVEWPDLVAAAERAHQACEAAAAKAPADQARAERRDAVATIRELVAGMGAWLTAINAELRGGAAPAIAA